MIAGKANCTLDYTYHNNGVTVNITRQADIDAAITEYPGCWDQLNIYEAEGSLDFKNVSQVPKIDVSMSPNLTSLAFPELQQMIWFEVRHAEKLFNISMPRLGQLVLNFTITDTPTLQQIHSGIDVVIVTLILRNLGPPTLSTSYHGMTGVADLVIDTPKLYFPDVGLLGNLTYYQRSDFAALHLPGQFQSVRSLAYLKILGDTQPSQSTIPTIAPQFPEYYINGSLTLQNLHYSDQPEISSQDSTSPNSSFGGSGGAWGWTSPDLTSVTHIKEKASIASNSFTRVHLSSLQSVGGDVDIVNNTSCSFSLDQLSNAGSIRMIDNPGSSIPSLRRLEQADSIHIRGYINTTSGPNIFPSLKFVPGSVIIEPWNDDFSCSKLVAQFHDNIIASLSCNGTDNATSTATTTSPTSSSNGPPSARLSEGQWAGIGIGAGILVLGAIIAITWLVSRRRRGSGNATDVPTQAKEEEEEVKPPAGAIYEMQVPHTNMEMPDDHLKELLVPVSSAWELAPPSPAPVPNTSESATRSSSPDPKVSASEPLKRSSAPVPSASEPATLSAMPERRKTVK
ncbi:hypothetical protein F5Y17DRAFT_475693 [Xylariaceae sp. FL0594]|nr:hypothetical protein F5Y17DRAFT_475693 [Xylariaceae sp. FL0594]